MTATANAGPRTIAVTNGKGGVGKTTTSSHFAGMAAAAGYPTLLVDLDPQGNIGEDLGYSGTDLDDEGRGLVNSVVTGGSTPLTPIKGVRPNLDVIPGGDALDELADMIAGRQRREAGNGSAAVLAEALAPVVGDYTLVVLDCPPRHEILEVAALVAASWVVIPTKSDSSSIKGLKRVAKKFGVARQLNTNLSLLGVVIYGVNPSATRLGEEVRGELREALQEAAPVFAQTIRHVESPARAIRRRGQLAHEIERDLLSGAERDRVKADKSTRAASSAAGSLAGDFENLTAEILKTLLAREARGVGR